MDILATLFPSAFPALALSHFVALLSPGPDFFCWWATPSAIACAAASACVSVLPPETVYILFWRLSAGDPAPGATAVYGD